MIYTTLITAQAKGTKQAAVRTPLKINKGLIWLMEVDFPPGCVGLVHVQIFDGKYQLLPASPDMDLSGDGQLLRYDDLYLKEAAPFELVVVTWNTDELWDHTVQVRIGVASTRLFMGRYLPSVGWEDFGIEMEKVRENQKEVKRKQIQDALTQLGEG